MAGRPELFQKRRASRLNSFVKRCRLPMRLLRLYCPHFEVSVKSGVAQALLFFCATPRSM
jgi:hypothetical protein